MEPNSENKNACFICDKKFTRKDNMLKHVRAVHDQEPLLTKNFSIKCPDCSDIFETMEKLRSHVASAHGIAMETEELDFPTFEDFLLWKEATEKESWCSYIMPRQAFVSKSGQQTSHYRCHRSGFYVNQSTGKRHIKSQGSKKLNGFCPAEMIVVTSSTDVKVKFHSSHYGHDVGYGHVFLTQNERKEFASQLDAGIDMDHVLQNVRNVSCSTFQRLHLVQKKDLHNIKRDFKIAHNERLHESDCLSVKLWVKHMTEMQDCPVAYYKEQGQIDETGKLKKEDFEIVIMTKFQKKILLEFGMDKVCIDSTHGTNAYDFNLTTLMVVDEFGAGFPVAFCLSNKIDAEAMRVFFEAIKSQTGAVAAEIFMSDDAQAYYNAWKSVMGPVPHQLLCNWHVDKNWRNNLKKIAGNSIKKIMVYKTLRVLMQEIDKDKFVDLIAKVIEQLLDDKETKEFGLYFREHYAKKPELWAFCYRARLGINTNMYLESLHKVIKHIYLSGKKIKRVDKIIFTLMKLVRDKVFERLSKVIKKTPSKKIGKIRASHLKSSSITSDMIEPLDEDTWQIQSASIQSEKYVVQKIKEPICIANCLLKCTLCNICIHMFECTCVDNVVRLNICKHIHACQMLNSISLVSTQDEVPDTCVDSILEYVCEPSSSNSVDNQSLGTVVKKLKMCEDILLSNTPSNENLNKINSHLDKVLSLLKSSTYVPIASTVNEPSNKKIAPQVRFHSTKRKRAPSQATLSKPLANERHSIVEGLLHPTKEIEHVHADFDHFYSK